MAEDWTFAPLPSVSKWLMEEDAELMTLHESMVERCAILTPDFVVFGDAQKDVIRDHSSEGRALDWIPLCEVSTTRCSSSGDIERCRLRFACLTC